MFLSDLSIKRPVVASVMMLALVTLGIFSYRRLAIDMYPNVEFPFISIVTVYPGASPETIEREVSKRIEEAVNPISGVRHVMSFSREGVSIIWIEFQLNVKANDAAQETRAKVAGIRGDLPRDIEEPIIQKADVSALPIVSIAIRSNSLSPRDLTKLVEKKIKQRLENIQGVGKADLVGPVKREVSVDLDPAKLESLGLGIDEVIGGLQSENVNIPVGRLTKGTAEYPIRVSGKPEIVDGFKTMVISQRNDSPISLGDVADVRDGAEEQRSLALINGQPAVALDIIKQTGANTVSVVDAVKKEIGVLQNELPAGISLDLVRDGSISIRDSVRDVQETLILGAILTILIVFCFLNSWRSTVITGLTLPISVISSFIIMNFMGMTLNMMTLMALSLAIGLLIDDAIVVRENIVRHLEHGQDHFTAAREGTSEIGLAVLATTFSIVAVFVPVAYMKGIVGQFFFQFGITVTFAVLISLFVSFTLDPMLSSRWVDPDIDRSHKRHAIARVLDRFNDWFDRMADQYKIVIGWALDHRTVVVAAAGVTFIGGLLVFGTLKSEFIPSTDQGEAQINFTTAPDASIEETRGRIDSVLEMLHGVPEVSRTYATIGAGDSGTVRNAMVYLKLVDRSDRKRHQADIMKDVRARLQSIPGIIPSVMEVNQMDDRKKLLINVRGQDLKLLKHYAAQLKNELYTVSGIVDLESSLDLDTPEYRIRVDRERAMDAGVRTADIVQTVGALVGGRVVSTYEDEDGDAVNVRVRLPKGLRENMSQVSNLRLSVQKLGAAPALVPLADLVHHDVSAVPTEISRQDLSRQAVVSANLEGVPLGQAVADAKKAAQRVKLAPGYQILFSGETEQMDESFGYMAEAMLLAVIFVYLILAAQFESFIDPFAIMLSLPLSIVGMAGMLFLTGDTINIVSLIGLIMLMGLVTKNAILLVDYAKVLQTKGLGRREALIQAGRTRLRPIIMTTLAMIFGMIPLALGIGSGAEFRASMGRGVIGGLITSTMLTLIVVPVAYTILDDFGKTIRRRWAGMKEVQS